MCLVVPLSDQDGCTAELSLTQDPMGSSNKKHLLWNQYIVAQLEPNFDGIVIGWFSSKIVSGSAVALLLKAALIQVSDYRLLGASFVPCN